MKNRYSVLVVGMGKRGMHHALAFNANPRFQVTGICDIDRARLDAAAAKLGNPQQGPDAGALAKAVKPDVFCFTTLPNLRTPMVKTGIESGARLLAFEKPVALTSAEMFGIRDLIERAGVKAVVSHQHRYGAHYRKVREIIGSGALGRLHTVYGSATGWMTHILSHLVDYTCWFNQYTPATWVMAQAAAGSSLATIILRPTTSQGSCSSPTGCEAFTNAARAPPTSRRWRSGGARTALARRAPKVSPKCLPTAAGARLRGAGVGRAGKER